MMKSMNLMFQTSWVLLLGFRVQLRPSLVRFSFGHKFLIVFANELVGESVGDYHHYPW